MAGRIRSVKPEWLDDELLAGSSDESRVLSIALILMADDHGRGRAALATIASEAWRYQMERDASETIAKASRALRELVEMRFVSLYEINRQRYFEIRNWTKHQKVDHPGKPRVPAPEAQQNKGVGQIRENFANDSGGTRETLAPDQEHRSIGSTSIGVGSGSRDPEPPVSSTAIEFGEIIAAINRPRSKRGYSPINAMTLHGQAAAPYFALVDFFPTDTLASIEAAHEAWLATATKAESDNRCPVAWWLRAPTSGIDRSKKATPPVRKSEYRPLSECE